ncbi:hypothetical protein Kisp02_54740 [Kineosporia sp. NBRC 101731]|nr:hypothetical protein Kisp02_54740 [Kineosporia sp. NBRC 101731]
MHSVQPASERSEPSSMDSDTKPTNCDVAETAAQLSASTHEKLLWPARVQMALSIMHNTSECTRALSSRCAMCPWRESNLAAPID